MVIIFIVKYKLFILLVNKYITIIKDILVTRNNLFQLGDKIST